MALINHATRELTAKIVYYGPGLCGKTTNLKYIYECLEDDQRGPMLSLATEADRTLFFDFLPLEVGSVKGFRVRVQLYTVPGQVFYEETRRRVLKGSDGVVFVADSQRSMSDSNKESYRQLIQHLRDNDIDPEDVPMVLQYNKRDLADILTLEEMDRDLNAGPTPFFEAVASEGIGVEDTFAAITRLVLKKLVSTGIEEPTTIRQRPQAVKTASGEIGESRSGGAERGAFPAPARSADRGEHITPLGAEPPSQSEALSDSQSLFALQPEDDALDLLAEEADLCGVLADESSGLAPAELFEEVESARPDFQEDADDNASAEAVVLKAEPGVPVALMVEIGGRRFKMTIRFEAIE